MNDYDCITVLLGREVQQGEQLVVVSEVTD